MQIVESFHRLSVTVVYSPYSLQSCSLWSIQESYAVQTLNYLSELR